MSMRTVWQEEGEDRAVTAPVSLIVSAFAPCDDVRTVLTPVLSPEEDTALLLVDLGRGPRSRPDGWLGARAGLATNGQHRPRRRP